MIIWLTPKGGYTPATKGLLGGMLIKNGCEPGSTIFQSLHTKVPNLADYQKKPKIPLPHNINAAKHVLAAQVEALKPKLIVVNDEASLRAITEQPYTLATTRGSIYHFGDTPVLVLDDLQKLQYDPISKFIIQFDFAKLVRYALGKQKKYPPFQYFLCESVQQVSEHCERAKQATLVSIDTETHGKFITVIDYTYDWHGALVTFSVPFFDPHTKPDYAYWAYENEVAVRELLKDLNASPVPKAFQNGGYDAAYLIKEGMPVTNYYVDSQNLMHCIWIEAPKRLHQITSYFCDNYVYWKDDGKGVKEDDWGKADRNTLLKYWRYCGLDTYYTWLSCYELLPRLTKQKWAVDNYAMEFALQVGPCLESSLRGIPIDKDAHAKIMQEQLAKSIAGERDIRALTGEEKFRLTAPHDAAWFLYDFCKQSPTRLQYLDPAKKGRKKYGPRSVDEKVMKIMKEQNNGLSCISRNFIDRLLKAKKPGNVLNNYQNLHFLTMKDQFCHWHNAAGTDTFRFSTGSNQFWIGRNSQNIPEWLREWLTACPDYVLFCPDYSSSDDRFIAYESEDPDKMALVESDKDPHCYHASVFFQKNYDWIKDGWKRKDPIIVHPITGIRQNTKRVTHGRNFRMGAATLYNTMGRDAVIATAVALGHTRAAAYTDKELIGVCQVLVDMYDHPTRGLYKRLRKWQDEIVEECIKNGNRFTNTFGLTRWFLGDVKNDDETQRALSSCYGQMGTAGNINRALKEIYYSGVVDLKCMFLQQGHDSLMFLVHKSVLHEKVSRIKEIMEAKFVIHGRSISIPIDPKLGYRWSENMMSYDPSVTYEQVMEFEHEQFDKKYPRRSGSMIEQFAAMDFGSLGMAGEDQTEFETSDDTHEAEFELSE